MQSTWSSQKLLIELAKIVDILTMLFRQANFETILLDSLKVSKQLSYFLKIYQDSKGDSLAIENYFEEVFKILSWILKSSEYQKHGHSLPLFGYLLNKYQYAARKAPFLDQQKVLERLSKNQKSHSYRNVKEGQISRNQLKQQSLNKFHQILLGQQSNQIVFPNSQCVCCSTVFIKNFWLRNINPLYKDLIGLNFQNFDVARLEKILFGVINRGGGAVIIGVKMIEGQLQVSGLTYQDEEQMFKKQLLIANAITKINPPCQYKIQRVLVHSNFLQDDNEVAKEFMRICFRITVLPFDFRKIHYTQVVGKGKDRLFEIYSLDSQLSPIKVTSQFDEQQKFQSVYSLMHRIYNKRSPRVNYHQNILCSKPHTSCSKRLSEYISSGALLAAPSHQQKVEPEDALKFKYKNTCLLVVSKKKDDRYVLSFGEIMKGRKQSYELIKPFEDIFKPGPGIRSVWMLSHECSLNEVKKLMKMEEEKGMMKADTIKILPVEAGIQVEKSKINDYHRSMVEVGFKERYGRALTISQCEMVNSSNEVLPALHFSFVDFDEAIFVYLSLEELHIWPYFTKQGTPYKKKFK